MDEPTSITITGNKLWMVVGILSFIGLLILIGVVNPTAREYIKSAMVWMQAVLVSIIAWKG